jgi:multicomponent Na+:H+ antiporter subunit E
MDGPGKAQGQTDGRHTARSALLRWVGLFGFWLLLSGLGGTDGKGSANGAEIGAELAVGLLAATAATWVSLRLLPSGPGRVCTGALVRLAWRFLWQSVVAGIGVARLAFAPRLALRPGWLNYPLKIPPGPGRATFGALTSLVPGTLPVGAGPGDTMVYHCLDLSQPVAQGLAADEALLIEALSITAQGGGQTHV